MIESKASLIAAIPQLVHHHILVIGDLILDEYLSGEATRLSREAPIPVLEFTNRQIIPGGAANPAMNIAALGSRVSQIGLIGDDITGQELIEKLGTADIGTGGIIRDPSRHTTQKTRLMAHGSLRFPQQVARLDRIDREPPSKATEQAIIKKIETFLPQCQAVLISDYRNGLLTEAIIQAIAIQAQQHGRLVAVDSQGNLDKYRGFDLVRVNHQDTEAYLNETLVSESDFRWAASTLCQKLQTQAIIIGRGPQGVSLQDSQGAYHHFYPVNVTEVYDVTGAGDTSIAVLTLGLAGGIALPQTAQLANYAAGLVVQRLGNVTPTAAQLKTAIQTW
ncbi:MAG: bifunctional ADP-heptose synthase [Chloroflexota bacterium]